MFQFCTGVIGDEGIRGEPGLPGPSIDNNTRMDPTPENTTYKGYPGEPGPKGDNGWQGFKGEIGAKGQMVSQS